MLKINVAIDGPAGSGKGVTAKELARRLNYSYLDTGAMYRCVGLYMKEKGITKDNFDKKDLNNIVISFDKNNHIHLNNKNVETKIRTPEVSQYASDFSTLKDVRNFLVKQQQEIVKEKGFIAEGRDIGIKVMPEAELKIYLTASVEARTQRRYKDYKEQGLLFSFDEIKLAIEERDHQDMTREFDPLIKADDAIEVDTTELSIEEQVELIEKLARKHIDYINS